MRSVWKCCFRNIVNSWLLFFLSVKYASYFQLLFEKKFSWKFSVVILLIHGQCCLNRVNASWEVSCRLWPPFCYFYQGLLCEHSKFWASRCLISLQFVFRFFFSGQMQIQASKWKYCLSSSSVIYLVEVLEGIRVCLYTICHLVKARRGYASCIYFSLLEVIQELTDVVMVKGGLLLLCHRSYSDSLACMGIQLTACVSYK